MIPYLILTAVASGAICWCAGHRTARVRIVVIGATPAQDQAAFLQEEAARFWQLVNTIDQPEGEQQ